MFIIRNDKQNTIISFFEFNMIKRDLNNERFLNVISRQNTDVLYTDDNLTIYYKYIRGQFYINKYDKTNIANYFDNLLNKKINQNQKNDLIDKIYKLLPPVPV